MIALPKFRKNRNKIALFSILVLLLVAVYGAFPFVQDFQNAGDRIVIKEKQLRKYRQRVAEGKTLEKKIDSRKQVLEEIETGLLKAETPSLAAVDIQNTLHSIANASGAEITTLRVLDPAKAGHTAYVGIPVQITLRTDIQGLKTTLHKIENAEKYLTVDELRIRVSRSNRAKRLGPVQANITVKGYMKKSS